MNKNIAILLTAVGFVASFAVVAPVFAQTQAQGHLNIPNGMNFRFGMHGGLTNGFMPGVFGTVSAINGTTLTVTSKVRPNATTTSPMVYTIDASNATVMKNGTSSSISSVATGDMVMVQGTVSGSNVTATMIRDGVGMTGRGGFSFPGRATSTATNATPPIQGNGEPVIGGSVTAINGSTLTVTNASNVTYTIDVSNAKIVKNGVTSTVSAVATGDNVIVQGTVNGTSVVASSVIDQVKTGGNGNGTPNTALPANASPTRINFGFLGSIGSFFKRIFGF